MARKKGFSLLYKKESKMIFELINPSDKCTFEAESVAVACFVVLNLNPNFALRDDKDERVDMPCALFTKGDDIVKWFETRFGEPFEGFLDNHHEAVANSFASFFYGDAKDRKLYNRVLDTISSPDEREKFKKETSDERRTSCNDICGSAFTIAKQIRELSQKK